MRKKQWEIVKIFTNASMYNINYNRKVINDQVNLINAWYT